jgi:replicative DNA helicase
MASMRSGNNFSAEQYNGLSVATARVSEQKMFVDDKPSVGVAYIRAKSRQIKRKNGLDLIVIDYLQLMQGKGDNRVQEIGSISRGLKALAKELKVTIIALAQLNRGLEQRSDKRPILSDLRDSGEIEQDADIVLMLHREDYYDKDSQYKGLAECLIRKQRNGALGDVVLAYIGEIMRFESYSGIKPDRSVKQTGRKGFEYS